MPKTRSSDALRERLAREHAPADLLDDVWLAILVHLLPELKERYPDLEPVPLLDDLAQLRLFEAVARLLESLGARAPLVWLLDDVQWTDTGTRDLLLYLVRRWMRTPQPVLVVLTVRTEARANDSSLQRWMRELRRVGGIAERTLGALTQSDLASLLAQLTNSPMASETIAAWAEWLFAETGGQPFYVVETLRALGEQNALVWGEDADGRWRLESLPVHPSAVAVHGGMPSSVRELIQSRLDGLGETARALVAAGAALGGRMRLDALAGMLHWPDEVFSSAMLRRPDDAFSSAMLRRPDEAFSSAMLRRPDDVFISAIDELLRTGVWVEAPPATTGRRTPRYVFAHDRIHDVAYAALGSARRQSVHRAALNVLQTLGAEPAELARQAREADLPDLALRYSVAAGDASMAMFAVADALVHYEQAHALLPAQHDRLSAGAELLPRLGRAYEVAHRLPEARAVHQELRVIAQAAGAPRLESQALTALGTLTMHERWDSDAAVALIREAAEIAAASGEITAQAESEWSLAQIHAYAHGRELAIEHATRAVALARRTDDPDLQARSLNALAMGHLILGHAAHCADAARESVGLFRACGNDLMRWDSQRLLAASSFQLAHARMALSVAREALEGCMRAHNVWGQAWGAKEVVHALLDLGGLEEAVDAARRAVDAARALDDPVGVCMALTLLCRAYRRIGQVARARTAALEALESDASVPTRPLRESILADLAACAATDGDWDAAARYALEAFELRDGTLYLDTGLTRWMETAALVRAGHAEEAESDLCTWGPRLDGCPRYRIPYLRGLAVIADWKEQPSEAARYRAQAHALAQQWHLDGELAL